MMCACNLSQNTLCMWHSDVSVHTYIAVREGRVQRLPSLSAVFVSFQYSEAAPAPTAYHLDHSRRPDHMHMLHAMRNAHA